jgi:DEAD/DEAH box helicase domain-containing protein
MARAKKNRRRIPSDIGVAALVQWLQNQDRYSDSLVYHHYIPAVEPSFGELTPALPESLAAALKQTGVRSLFSHQAEAVDAVRCGENVVVSTPTASGKTLIYNLPVLESCLQDPGTRALYLFPLKALEQDQHRKMEQLSQALGGNVSSAIYDGDTSAYRRRKILADPPNIILTNPDMLHLSILGYHQKWEQFFRGLRYVVVDELHTYKGIFGAHFSSVVARLKRIAAHYGADPVFIASSATVGNPGQFARKLFGTPFKVVDSSGAPSAGRHFVFINPQELRPATMAARLMADVIGAGFKTITFTKSRRSTELIHSWLVDSERKLAGRVSSYRSGYLPAERRQIEQDLAGDKLDGVISTSALEMGIDIGGLDACVLVGYPGTVTQTWQRGGRVGRGDRESVVLMIAQADALDQFFMRHPENFFSRGCEQALVDPENPFILADHLECAAAEIPLEKAEIERFTRGWTEATDKLLERGRLVERASDGRVFSASRYPHRQVSLRQAGESFTILDGESDPPQRIGSVGGARALAECHPGAIYLHRARQYRVARLDMEKRNVYVERSKDPYYTMINAEKDTEILEVLASRPEGNFLVRYGRLKVTERINGFQKRGISGGELLSTHPLELPPQVFETTGFWIEIPAEVSKGVTADGGHFMGGIHSVEHASISIFPLFVLCDRNDIGGICFTEHPQVGGPAIFIYDGYPGGVGIAHGVYGKIGELLDAARKLIDECDCESGCPSCIHSPKCGSGNKPLDKQAAVAVLEMLLGIRTLPVMDVHETEAGKGKSVAKQDDAPDADKMFPQNKKIYVFDLETQRSAEEVGGWRNKHLMRVSCAVLQDVGTGEMLTFTENDMDRLVDQLFEADLVVGFNVIDFDYNVLRAYSAHDLTAIKTFDILADIHERLGHRIGLGALAEAALGEPKSADGLQAIEWFREGKLEKVIDYCGKDVILTGRLFEFGLRKGYLLYEHREAGMVRLKVDWDLDNILERDG